MYIIGHTSLCEYAVAIETITNKRIHVRDIFVDVATTSKTTQSYLFIYTKFVIESRSIGILFIFNFLSYFCVSLYFPISSKMIMFLAQ